jgi:hypothetical protein
LRIPASACCGGRVLREWFVCGCTTREEVARAWAELYAAVHVPWQRAVDAAVARGLTWSSYELRSLKHKKGDAELRCAPPRWVREEFPHLIEEAILREQEGHE